MNGKASLYSVAVFVLTAAISGFAQWDPIFWDGKFHPIWNKQDFSNWMEHSSNWGTQDLGTDSAAIVLDAKSHRGNMTHMIYNRKISGNMEARVVMRMPTTGGARAGFLFRSRCRSAIGTLENSCGGSPWEVCGPQMSFGSSYSGEIANSCKGFWDPPEGTVTGGTASAPPKLINNLAVCRESTDLFSVQHWNEYRVRVFNDTAWTFINGVMCAKLFLDDTTETQATTPGLISLKYESTLKIEFKDVELRNSDIDSTTVSARSRHPGASGFAIQGAPASVFYKVPVAGKYSLRIADMRGKLVKIHSGTGPVAHANLPLGTSGLFLAEIRSPGCSFTTKFVAD
ncbi:MAG: family 16 glycoside hydrolase [Fibrobacteria bacterium]